MPSLSVKSFLKQEAPNHNLKDFIVWGQTLCGLLVLGLIGCLLFIFYRCKMHKKSFYFLVMVELSMSGIIYLNSVPALRLRNTPVGVTMETAFEWLCSGFLTFTDRMCYFFFHLQFCTAVSLSGHRFLTMFYPGRSKSVEKKWIARSVIYFAFSVVYSILVTYLTIGTSYEFSIENDELIGTYHPEIGEKNDFYMVIFASIYFVIFLAFGLVTFTMVFMDLKKTGICRTAQTNKKLTLIALSNWVTFLGILLYAIFSNVVNCETSNWFCDNRSILATVSSDLMLYSMPLYLLLLTRSNRRNLKHLISGEYDLINERSNVPTPMFVKVISPTV